MSDTVSADDITAVMNEAASTGAAAQPTPDAPAPDAPVAEPESLQIPDAPWSKDLQGLGLGDYTPKVDQYLRTSIQPRMTELEQKLAEHQKLFGDDPEAMTVAAQMYDAFATDPQTAFAQLAAAMGYDFPQQDGVPQGTPAVQPELPADPLADDPRLQYLEQLMQQEQERKDREIYDNYFNEVAGKVGAGFDRTLYETLFLGTQGDEEKALELYGQYTRAAGQAADPPVPAPPVLNEATGRAAAEPPAQPASIADAMTEFMAEQKMLNKR